MQSGNQEGTLAADLAAFMASGVGADVTLVVGETSLQAHRAILMARSPLFRAAFSKGTPEANSRCAVVNNMEPDVLQQLLTFMYSDEAPRLESMAAQLLPASVKYGLPRLKEKCEQQLIQDLSVENAATAAMLALHNECDDLGDAAVTFIEKNAFQVMFTEGWAEALRSHPHTVAKISLLAKIGVPVQAKSVCDEEANRLGWELYEAAAAGKVGDMQKLLAAGASLEVGDEDSDTPLFMAASEGHVEAVRWLLKVGAQADRRNYYEQTPLHKAAERGHASVIHLLAAASANVDVTDNGGDTPLHLSAEHGHLEATRALLQAGAGRGVKNEEQRTPLDVAIKHNRQEVVDILRTRVQLRFRPVLPPVVGSSN